MTTGCLDPKKRYYISVLPGDAAQPFNRRLGRRAEIAPVQARGTASCGHGMGGAPIAKGQTQRDGISRNPARIRRLRCLSSCSKTTFPLNGEHDAGGGIDVLSPNEAGLGGFQITLSDDAGGTGDATGNRPTTCSTCH